MLSSSLGNFITASRAAARQSLMSGPRPRIPAERELWLSSRGRLGPGGLRGTTLGRGGHVALLPLEGLDGFDGYYSPVWLLSRAEGECCPEGTFWQGVSPPWEEVPVSVTAGAPGSCGAASCVALEPGCLAELEWGSPNYAGSYCVA